MASEKEAVRHILGLLDRHSTKTLEHAVQQFNDHRQRFHESLLELRTLKPSSRDVFSNVPEVERISHAHGMIASCMPKKEILNGTVEQEDVENHGVKQYSLRPRASRNRGTSGAPQRVTRSRAKQPILSSTTPCNKSEPPNFMVLDENFVDTRTTVNMQAEPCMQAFYGVELSNEGGIEHPSNSNPALPGHSQIEIVPSNEDRVEPSLKYHPALPGHPQIKIVLPLAVHLAQPVLLCERACSSTPSQSSPKSDKERALPCLNGHPALEPHDKILSIHETGKHVIQSSNGALNLWEDAEATIAVAQEIIAAIQAQAKQEKQHIVEGMTMDVMPSLGKRKRSLRVGPTCDMEMDTRFWTRDSTELEAFKFDSDEEACSRILRLSARHHKACKVSPPLQPSCNEVEKPATLRTWNHSMERTERGHVQLESCSTSDGPQGKLSCTSIKGVNALEKSLQDSGDAHEGTVSLPKMMNTQEKHPARSPSVSIGVNKRKSTLLSASKSITPATSGQSVHITQVVPCGDLTFKQEPAISPRPFSSTVNMTGTDGSMLRDADVRSYALLSSDSSTQLQGIKSTGGHDEGSGVLEEPLSPALEKLINVLEKNSQDPGCILKDTHEGPSSLLHGPCVEPQGRHQTRSSTPMGGRLKALVAGTKHILRWRSQSLNDARLHCCAENTTYSSPRLFSSTGNKKGARCMEVGERALGCHALISMGASIRLEGSGLTVEPMAHVGGCVSELKAAPLHATTFDYASRSFAGKSAAQLTVEEDSPMTGKDLDGEPMVEPATQAGCTREPEVVYAACSSASRAAQTPQQVSSSTTKSASQLNHVEDSSINTKDMNILGFDHLLAQRTVNSQRRERARSPGNTCCKEFKRVKIAEDGKDSHPNMYLPSGFPRPLSEKGVGSSHTVLTEPPLFSPVRPLQLAYEIDGQESPFCKLLIDGSVGTSQCQMEGTNKLCKGSSWLPGLGRTYLDTPGVSSARAELADMSNTKLRWKPDWHLNSHVEESVGKENQSPVPWSSTKSYSSTSILSEKQENAKARKVLGYANLPAGMVDNSQNRYNLAADTRSFLDFVQLKPMPPAYPNGKTDVRVKALEAAELAKKQEEKCKYERKIRKLKCNDAKSTELEGLKDKTTHSCAVAMAGKGVFDKMKRVAEQKMKMDQEKAKRQEGEQRRKEDERKKKEAELADKKRKREDEERREREEKRKRVEEVQRARKEQEERQRMELNEKEMKRKLLEDHGRERKAHEEEAKRLRRLAKEKEAERRRKQEQHLKAVRLAEKQAERKQKEILLQARAHEDDQVSQLALGKLSVLSSESFAVSASTDWEAQTKSLKCETLRSQYSTPCTTSLAGTCAPLQQLPHETEIHCYDISPYRSSSDDDDDRPKKQIPLWARKDFLLPHLLQQQNIDPDAIFSSEKTCSLEEIFGTAGSRRCKDFTHRRTSGNWVADRATWKEELEYKRAMGYIHDG